MLPIGSSARPHAALIRVVWLATLLLVLIGIAIVTRRTLSLFGLISTSSSLSGSAVPDAAVTRYAPLTMAHIYPGLLYLVLGPFQFITTLRAKRPKLHRRMGYVVLTSGLVTGVTALLLTMRVAIGGATERAASTL